MRTLAAVAGVTLAALAGSVGVAAAGMGGAGHGQAPGIISTAHARSRAHEARARTLVSVRLAAIGANVTSPRGPFRTRPAKLVFGSGLWIDHLKWADWGQSVAFASGMVHARVWPGHSYVTRAGGLMLDQLRTCGTKPTSYYTSVSMDVPDGFPENTESTATGIGEQALTPC